MHAIWKKPLAFKNRKSKKYDSINRRRSPSPTTNNTEFVFFVYSQRVFMQQKATVMNNDSTGPARRQHTGFVPAHGLPVWPTNTRTVRPSCRSAMRVFDFMLDRGWGLGCEIPSRVSRFFSWFPSLLLRRLALCYPSNLNTQEKKKQETSSETKKIIRCYLQMIRKYPHPFPDGDIKYLWLEAECKDVHQSRLPSLDLFVWLVGWFVGVSFLQSLC